MEDLRGEAGRVAAELDVRPAAGHVRGDGHRPAAPGLGDDPGFLLVEFRVQGLVLDAPPVQHLGQDFALLHGDRADEDGPAVLGHLADLVDEGVELADLVPEDEVRVVLPDHLAVGRDRHDLEGVDLVELLGLGHGRAGHPGELVVQPEVVLERDRGQGHRLALDAQSFLRLDGLVEPLAPAPARHLPPGELVDDDDLAVLDDVVAVALVEGVGLEGLLEVAGERRVRVVHVLDAEPALHLVDAFLGRADGAVLEVDEVVAALFVALRAALEAGHDPGERVVLVGRLLGLAADDERRPRLVDEDVVDLVDDREEAPSLHALVQLDHHVVAQVVEPELVVRAVRDVGRVGLHPRDRAQVDESLVGGRVTRLEDEARVVGDHPDAHAEEVEDRSHPLRVAPGQVVVDGHDVDAEAREAVEDRGHRGDEGLALAGLHLGDPALVKDGRADELDVEVAHPEGPSHGLTGRREDLRRHLVHGRLEPILLALAACLEVLAAAFEIGMVEFVLGRLVGDGRLVDLLADVGDPGADLLVRHGLELGLEPIRFVDHRLDASNLAVVRVDESIEKAQNHSRGSIGEPVLHPRSGERRRRAGRCRRAEVAVCG